MTKTKKKKKYRESFVYQRKTELYEKLIWGLESVIWVVASFFAGFEFHRSENIGWFLLFLGILLSRIQWKKIKKVTKRFFI